MEGCVGNVLTAENISSTPRAVTSPGTPITATPEPEIAACMAACNIRGIWLGVVATWL